MLESTTFLASSEGFLASVLSIFFLFKKLSLEILAGVALVFLIFLEATYRQASSQQKRGYQ